jgi:hypothetical protein
MKVGEATSSETLASTSLSRRRHIPEDWNVLGKKIIMNAFQRCLSESIAVKCYVFTQTCQEALSYVACLNSSEKL